MRMSRRLIGLIATGVAATAMADVPNDPKQVQPLSVGTRAPAFAAQTVDGKVRTFNPDGYRRPTGVIFYRGGWCPYCNMQLSDLHTLEPKLRARGFEHHRHFGHDPLRLFESGLQNSVGCRRAVGGSRALCAITATFGNL